ncbi:MAG: hypothetical protein KIS92_08785 [Planctomycetota bacterium]|nr:hypothetical protein [Planctomycetota bacterium]
MALGGYFHVFSESGECKLARLKRWRSAGWFRFTAGYAILVSLAMALPLAVLAGFVSGYGFAVRLLFLETLFFAMNLFASQFVWHLLPVGIEELEECDPARIALRREGFALFFCGLMASLSAALLPFHLGRAAAVPDVMLVASSLVVGAWGWSKLARYWKTSQAWPAHGVWARFVRCYGLGLMYFGLSAASVVRVYACYGDACWAEPLRRLMP